MITPPEGLDLTYERDPERVWRDALGVVGDVQEIDVQRVCDDLAVMAAHAPMKTAQLIIAIAAMVPTQDSTHALRARADALADFRGRWAS